MTLFAEGVRGSCSEQLIRKFGLRRHADPQSYGIGLKEVWQVPKEKHHKVRAPLSRALCPCPGADP